MSFVVDGHRETAPAQPIFIVGRQHSGNTMFANILSKLPNVLSMTGEGQFFERREEVERAKPENRSNVVARLIQESDSTKVNDGDRVAIAERLKDDNISDQPATLFARAMQMLVADAGCDCWAQKATSHIFYVDDIVNIFPRARFVFLARNPLDIAASFVRRRHRHKLIRMAVGWNHGFRRAESARDALGERFHIVRYEDIVREPEELLPELFDKLGLKYEEQVTDIPVVNRAGAGGRSGSGYGIDSSRVYYYQEQLQKRELHSVLRVIDEELLARHYPQLAERQHTSNKLPKLDEVKLWILGTYSFMLDHLRRGLQQPRSTLRRLARRLEF